MKTHKVNWWGIVILCVLVSSLSARAENSRPRPLKMKAHSQMVLNLADFTFEAVAWGEATHVGKMIVLGWGVFNPFISDGYGWGTVIAANGDEIFYDHTSWELSSVIVGGTGRFEGATGEFATTYMEPLSTEIDPVAGVMVLNFVWTMEGTITY